MAPEAYQAQVLQDPDLGSKKLGVPSNFCLIKCSPKCTPEAPEPHGPPCGPPGPCGQFRGPQTRPNS